MGMYVTCEELSCGGIRYNFLNYAPCPPPMMEYRDFFEHALIQNLSHADICSISRRCRLNGSISNRICLQTMTTTTTTTKSECSDTCLISVLSVAFGIIIVGSIVIFVKRKLYRSLRITGMVESTNGRKEEDSAINAGYEGDEDTLHDNNINNKDEGGDNENKDKVKATSECFALIESLPNDGGRNDFINSTHL